MSVFLCLGNVKLFQALFRDILGKGVVQILFWEKHTHTLERRVVGSHAEELQILDGGHSLFGHILLSQDLGDFLCTVVSVIEEYHHIAFLDAAIHCAVHNWLHKLIGHAFVIRLLHGLHHVVALAALSVHKLVVGKFNAVPALITVHSIIATGDCGNHASALGKVAFHILNKAFATLRVGVTAIHKAVQIHVFKAILFGNVAQGKQVGKRAVHASR